MKPQGTAPEHVRLTRSISLDAYATGSLAPLLSGAPRLEVGSAALPEPGGDRFAVVFAGYRLQDVPNYREALQTWFALVGPGGHLAIVVPHAFLYERQNALPSRWNPAQRRLYTPRSLMEEVEEALAPNTYRVRWLGDCDADYDYALDPSAFPEGRHDVMLVVQRIPAPSWELSQRLMPDKAPPADAFEVARTRIEVASPMPALRVLILKLDHLGDFIMGTPALGRARTAFPDAEITLVVGSWNLAAAQRMGLFDRIVVFDAFPRNASEEQADVRGKLSEFEALVTADYDVAIDLRTDHDTRDLLARVRAPIRAGIGTKARFGFLDVFLPVDGTRQTETAWERQLPPGDFLAASCCTRSRYQIACETIDPPPGAVIWGPYARLDPGHYMFEPFLEFDWQATGLITCDIAVDNRRVFAATLSDGGTREIPFRVGMADGLFEFRLWTHAGEHIPRFQFFGGRLRKQGASSVLHQSEYLSLLIELVAMRVSRHGVLREWHGTS